VTPENAKTQSWVTETQESSTCWSLTVSRRRTVWQWQRIPGRRAHNSKTPTTITVQSITRNDQLLLTGGSQMLTFVCNCSSGTAELFHEENTSIHQQKHDENHAA